MVESKAEQRLRLVERQSVNPNTLSKIVEILNQSHIDYRIVGSLAIAAWTKRNIPCSDVDVICFSGDLKQIQDTQVKLDKVYLASFQSDISPLRVDLSRASIEKNGSIKHSQGFFIKNFTSETVLENGRYQKVFRDLKTVLPSRVMEPVDVLFQGVHIKTLIPETILHLYIARGGFLKPKDKEKLKILASYIRENPTCGVSHQDFLPFHKFARDLRTQYPFYAKTYWLLANIDHLAGGIFTRDKRLTRVTVRKMFS